MNATRRCRLLTVLLSLCALLFAQTALAAYACPAAADAMAKAQAAQMAQAGMPCAEAMAQILPDDEQPGLCHAHCEDEQSSAEHYQLPTLATLDQLGAVLTVALPPVFAGMSSPQPPLMRRSAAPPLAVRYCCFRL